MDPIRSSPSAPELGVVLPAAGGSAVADVARAAERAGVDWLLARAVPGREALVVSAYAAAVTRRIRIATAGLALPMQDIAALGRAARTLDDLSGGRLALGVVDPEDAPPTGASRAHDAQFRELRTGPAAALPLLIEGSSRRTVERVARDGDALVLPPHATRDDVSLAHAMLREGWRWHDRGGAPRVVAFAPAMAGGGDQLAELGGAGAAAVVLTGVADGDALERVVAALVR